MISYKYIEMKKGFTSCALVVFSLMFSSLTAQVKFSEISQVSTDDIIWQQFGAGNSGLSNLVKGHPNFPFVFTSQDLRDTYQMLNPRDNSTRWSSIRSYDDHTIDPNRLAHVVFSPDGLSGMAIEREYTDDLWFFDVSASKATHNWRKVPVARLPYAQIGDEISALNATYRPGVWYVGAGQNYQGTYNYMHENVTMANPHGDISGTLTGKIWRLMGNTPETLTNEEINLPESLAQVCDIIEHPNDPNRLFVATNYGLFVSSDAGSNWSKHKMGLVGEDQEEESQNILDMDYYYDSVSQKLSLYLIKKVQYAKTNEGVASASSGGAYRIDVDGDNEWINLNGNLTLTPSSSAGTFENMMRIWFGTDDEITGHSAVLPNLSVIAVDRFSNGSSAASPRLYVGAGDATRKMNFASGVLWRLDDQSDKKWIGCFRVGSAWSNNESKLRNIGQLTDHEANATKEVYYSKDDGSGLPQLITHPFHNVLLGHQGNRGVGNGGWLYSGRGIRTLSIGADGDVFILVGHHTFLSSDKGDNWEQLDDVFIKEEGGRYVWTGRGNSNLPGQGLRQTDDRFYLGTGEHGLFEVLDKGDENVPASWINYGDSPHTIGQFTIDPANDHLYGVQSRQGSPTAPISLHVSEDGGNEWFEKSQFADEYIAGETSGNTVTGYKSMIVNEKSSGESDIYFCSPYIIHSGSHTFPRNLKVGIYASYDSGATWEVKGQEELPFLTENADGSKNSTNIKNNYELKESRLVKVSLLPWQTNKTALFAAVTSEKGHKGGLYKIPNKGRGTWELMEYEPGKSFESVNDLAIVGNKVYVAVGTCVDDCESKGLWVSDNKGVVGSWQQVLELDEDVLLGINTSPLNENYLVLRQKINSNSASGSIMFSRDGGVSWSKVNNNVYNMKIKDMMFDKSDPRFIWCSNTSGFHRGVIKNSLVTSLDQEELPHSEVAYPNPTSNFVFLEGLGEDKNWTVFDMKGKNCRTGSGEKVDLTGLEKGLYIVKTAISTSKIYLE